MTPGDRYVSRSSYVLVGVATFLLVQFLFWYGGANVFERSVPNAFLFFISLGCSVVAGVAKKQLKL